MTKSQAEWLKQAEYDMDTAEAMFDAGRYSYAVFMAHLAMEKALKGLCQGKLGEMPPKTHSLPRLLDLAGVRPPEDVDMLLQTLNEAQTAARYPEDLEALQRRFTQTIARELLDDSKELLEWIRPQL